MADAGKVCVLQLEEDLTLNTKLFHIPLGHTVRFTLAPQLQGRSVVVECNHPLSDEEDFQRLSFHPLSWSKASDEGEECCEVLVRRSGCYNFLFNVQPPQPCSVEMPQWPAYKGTFLVDPVFHLGDVALPPAALVVQTVLPRCLGPLSEWKDRLAVSQYAGYNVIHFTPVQELGGSGSAYSIREQTRIEPDFFPGENLSDDEARDRLKAFLQEVRKPVDQGGMGMLSVVDMVWNHTSTDSRFLNEHPEAGYNLAMNPEFIPAYVFDQGVQLFSRALALHLIPGIPKDIKSTGDVTAILSACRTALQDTLRLWEFFVVNVDTALQEFRERFFDAEDPNHDTKATELIIKHISNKRHGMVVDFNSALDVCRSPREDGESDDAYLNRCSEYYKKLLDEHNLHAYNKLNDDMDAAFNHMQHVLELERLDPKGPLCGPITLKSPMMVPLFTNIKRPNNTELQDLSVCPLDQPDFDPRFVVMHNGWVWSGSAQEFAEPRADIYFRRELIVWGDCVKLRYGRKPEDSPWLWDHMTKYTCSMAATFDGFRIDNCHATPLHVGQYLIDKAREVNPNIYVFAELYTGSPSSEALFSNTLGMTSIIREALIPNSPSQLSALIHTFGGRPIGSFQNFLHPVTFLHPAMPFALFFDGTHDNMTPEEILTHHANLPISGLVAMVFNAIGSNRGYDELYPTRAKVVNERKLYRSWSDKPSSVDSPFVDASWGILRAKAVLNRLHQRLAVEHFDEIYVDDMGDGIISATRHSPITLRSVLSITHHAHTPDALSRPFYGKPPIRVGGIVTKVLLSAVPPQPAQEAPFASDDRFLTGRPFGLDVKTDMDPGQCDMIEITGHPNEVNLVRFPAGSVLVIEIASEAELSGLLEAVHARLGWAMTDLSITASEPQVALEDIVGGLNLVDLNFALFRCKPEEESDLGLGDRAYVIPNFGETLYSGLQGVMSILEDVRITNNLAHPICDDLRANDNLMSFLTSHLLGNPRTARLGEWVQETFRLIARLPRSSIPVHFSLCVSQVYDLLVSRAWKQMSPFVQGGNIMVRELALCSVMFFGHDAPHSRLALGPSQTGVGMPCLFEAPEFVRDWGWPSLAAGFPHFAAGWKRAWSRDTFISLRGLLLITGRFAEARDLILFAASLLRHGLIPNLLDNGKSPRYNSRDSVWWFMQALQEYCSFSPEGTGILAARVQRRFPHDSREAYGEQGDAAAVPRDSATKEQPLHDIVQEIFEKHYRGISYREWDAGPDLDSNMCDEGFNVQIAVDTSTGLVTGGSRLNCGTWMDKMGASERAKNRFVPATPRDGADIEIVGLAKSAVRWIAQLVHEGIYPYQGVGALPSAEDVGQESAPGLTFADWNTRLVDSFEKLFWIPEDEADDEKFAIHKEHVFRRGIYKDSFGSQDVFPDYRFRPNLCIAMVVAPG